MEDFELKDIAVSFYRHMKSPTMELMTVGRVLKGICSDYYEPQVDKIRKLKDAAKTIEADEIKHNLHAVTFCATFKDRRLSSLYQHYNSLMVIDIDKLSNEEMARTKGCLEQDPYVACYWMSPSGTGWKGLVPLCYTNEPKHVDVVDKHHWAFIKLEEAFKNNYSIELDSSGKDITRLCFMSWDPKLRLKDRFERFEVDLQEMVDTQKQKRTSGVSKVTYHSTGEPINWNKVDGQKQEERTGTPHERRLLEQIYKYLEVRHLSITDNFDDWVKVAFAIAHTFHSVYGRKMFLKLCRLDGTAHDEGRSERLIYDAYAAAEKKSDFSSIVYLAKGKGFCW